MFRRYGGAQAQSAIARRTMTGSRVAAAAATGAPWRLEARAPETAGITASPLKSPAWWRHLPMSKFDEEGVEEEVLPPPLSGVGCCDAASQERSAGLSQFEVVAVDAADLDQALAADTDAVLDHKCRQLRPVDKHDRV